jgi:molecular chaperone GrpE
MPTPADPDSNATRKPVTKHRTKKKTSDHPPPGPHELAAEPSVSAMEAQTRPLEAPAPPEEPAEAAIPDRIASLEQELAQAQAQASEYLDGWQRERAEFLNYKKRVERDLESAREIAAASILTRYLAILDDIERALKERPPLPEVGPWVEGIQLIQRKLQSILDSEGVETIPAEGLMFDPTVHEAVTFEPGDGFREGQVIEVLRRGYRIGERVLRPAMVRVAR